MAFPPRKLYERLLYSLTDSYPAVVSSSLHLYPNSSTTCFIRGSIWFDSGFELRVFEYLDLSDGELLNYSYTVFYGEERVGWFDPQPHPELPALAGTFPHHYHASPDIKHNRQPAPGINFTEPNLPTLIAHVASLTRPANAH